MADTNGRYFPSIRGIHEDECRTCQFQQDYTDIRSRADALAQMDDGPDKELQIKSFEKDVWELLAEANEIADLRCQGNYAAAMAMYN